MKSQVRTTLARDLRMVEIEAEALALLPSRQELEADYHLWLSHLLPKHFRSAGPEQFAPHHEEFWGWGWKIKLGEIPVPPAYLAIWPRGGNKSTSAEGLAVALGARERRKFGLYVCRTQPQANAHVASISSMLLRSAIGRFYPGMANPQIIEMGNHRKEGTWNRSALTTGTDFTMQGYGLESALRGVRVEEYRPDLIIISDIDDINDKPGYVQSLLNSLAGSVLGTASNDCVVLFEQNLIHHNSMINRILTRDVDTLSDRFEGGPIPALWEPDYAFRNGKWFIVDGIPSWPGQDIEACQNKINTEGKDYFERECQHDVDRIIGRPRFNLDAIREFNPIVPTVGEVRIKKDHLDQESFVFYPAPTGAVSIWHKPQSGHRYAAGADTAEGIDVAENVSSSKDPDYSVLQIRDVESGEQVARVRGRITEGPFGEIVYAMLRRYNNAFLVPEVKGGYGRAMLNKLLELGYPEALIWNRHMYNEIAGQPQHKGTVSYHDFGWNTSESNRPTLIACLDEAITGHNIETYDHETIQEYRHFCYGSRRVRAEAGYHDDCVIADALCCVGIWLVSHRRPQRAGPPVIRYARTGEPVEGQDRDRDRIRDWHRRM